MKKSLMLAGVAALMALPAVAHAQTAQAQAAQAQTQREQIPLQALQPQTSVIYSMCRGLVAESQTECLNRVGARRGYSFVMMDLDGNSRLSASEIESGIGLPVFDPFTHGPYGRMTAEEFNSRHAGVVRFEDWNRDGDNWLSDDELSNGIHSLWDANGDGWVDQGEFDQGANG